jgi:RNA polymerase sigma-70 factor (ECF subfamily)
MVYMTPLLAPRLRPDRSFERIYQRHVGDVYRYALAVLRNPADAEDVAQTTFMNAYRAFQRGERPQNPQNWLIAIAHNVCRQRFRQSARRPAEVAYDDGVLDVVPEEDPGPSAEEIQRALGELAFNQRAALVMRELEGRSYAEIADILGVSVSAVETLIFRARRALREQLEGSLTCGEAERAISRQLDGRLGRPERGALRAHLRACKECEGFARSQRAQRNAIKALALVPIPTSLTSLFGGGGAAAAGSAVAIKAAAFVAAGTVVAGVGYEGAKRADLLLPASTAVHAAAVANEPEAVVRPLVSERPPSAGRAVAAAVAVAGAAKPEKKAKSAASAAATAKGNGPPAHAVAGGRDKQAKVDPGRPAAKPIPPGRAKTKQRAVPNTPPKARPAPKPKKQKAVAKPKPVPVPKQGKDHKPDKSVVPPAAVPVLPDVLDGAAQVLPAPGI